VDGDFAEQKVEIAGDLANFEGHLNGYVLYVASQKASGPV
jgi:hypothetical protein